MIPEKLILQGLYSYQAKQEIDFSQLMEGQIFGIFGATGSGKSTILEAISFALFGETERLNQRDDRNYNMMNLKSDELLIDFTFSNFDGKRYRFTVKGKRSGKHFEKVGTLDRSAYEWKNDDWLPLEHSDGGRILGLSYDNFRRTIIIPQGKFQEFLQLGEADRTRMLKEIFQLDKYEFYHQVSGLQGKNKEELNRIIGNLQQFEEVDAASIEKRKEQEKLLDESSRAEEKAVQEKEMLVKASLELKAQFEELENRKARLLELEEDSARFAEKEKVLEAYEKCRREFSELLNRQDYLRKSFEKHGLELEAVKKETAGHQAFLTEKEPEYLRLKAEFENLDELKALAGDYGLLIEAIELKGEMEAIRSRLEQGKNFVAEEKKQKEDLQEGIEKLKAAWKDKKASLPDQAALGEVNTWFTIRQNHREKCASIQKEQELIRHQLAETLEAAQNEIPEAYREDILQQENGSIGNYVRHILFRLETLNEDLEDIALKIRNYEWKNRLSEFTKQIHSGEPCPLCGSSDHPQVMKAEDVVRHLEEAAARQTGLASVKKLLEESAGKLRVAEATQSQIKEQMKKLTDALKEAESEMEKHQRKFVWDAYDPENEEAVKEAGEKAKRLNQEIVQCEADLEKHEEALKKQDEKLEKAKGRMEELRLEFEKKEVALGSALGRLQQLEAAEMESGSETLTAKRAETEARISSIREAYTAISDEIAKRKELLAQLSGRESSLKQQLETLEAELQEVHEALEKALESSAFEEIDTVRQILSQEIDAESLRKEINAWKEQLSNAKALLEEAAKKTEGKNFDAEQHEALQHELEAAAAALKETTEALITVRTILKELESDLKKKQELEKQREKVDIRAQNLQVLNSMFKGSGFVKYISGVYLETLCQEANKRFHKLTRQQLRLELNEKKNFEVRDFLNDGRTRSVKTLSGGQTFQVSLSLALSLAESVQTQQKAKQNFFFLDEGFGSLDKTSLQIVFETLKSLRQEHRIVGVISHVEELQQEIDVFLKIRNEDEAGSRVAASWEQGSL